MIARITPALALCTLAVVGCNRTGGADFGAGPDKDARFVADMYTWQCEEGGTNFYEGVYAFNVSLEVAPDALVPRSLPAPGGCSADLSMFGLDPNSVGEDIPEITDEPRWETDADSGELEHLDVGYYYDEVFDNVHNCTTAQSLLAGGTHLLDAGAITSAVTPDPGDIEDVTLSVYGDDEGYTETGFTFGDEIDIDWDVEGWDETWIQIRRERELEAWETVTCNATGMDEFTLGSEVWDLMTEDLPVEVNNVYVAFQNTAVLTMEDGQKVEVATRAMHVAVVQD